MPRDPCSELAKKITELAMHIGARPEVKNLDDVVAHMQKIVPQIERESLVASINEATSGYAKAKDEMGKKLDRLKREAKNDVRLRESVRKLDEAVKAGVFVSETPRPTKAPPEAIAKLRAERDRLQGIIDMRDPAKRKAVVDRINELDRHIIAGTMPPKRPQKPVSADLAQLRKIRDEKLRQAQMADPAKRTALKSEIAELTKAIGEQRYVPTEGTTIATPKDIKALREERDALRAKVDKFNPDRVDDWQKKVDVLEGHIKAGTLPSAKAAANPELNPKVAELKDRRDALLKALSQSDAAIKQRYLRDIENLTDRLEAGVFTLPEPKADRPMGKDIADLDYQRHQLKQQIQRKLDALKPKTIWGHAAEPFNAARAMMTSMDVSAVLRQGGFIALGNPIRAARELPDMFRALVSERRAYEINKAVFERPNAPLYHRDGLFLSEPGHGGLNPQEEKFVSRLAGKFPGVKQSERAYVTFLNKLRADSYDAMVRTLAKNGEATAEEGAAIANFINVATGRGKLDGKWQKSTDAMNTIFFAPRYITSRFQLLTGQPFTGGFKNAAESAFGKASLPGSVRTRKLIAQEYAKYLIGMGVVYSLGAAAGGSIEADPRSSDFGKIKFGETRLDPTSGLSAATVFLSRLASGSTKTAKGEIQPLRGEGSTQNAAGVMGRFVWSKMAPIPSAVVNTITGENLVGQKTGLLREAARLFIPIGIPDIYDAMQEQGIPKGTATSLMSLAGMGMNTYGPRTDAGELMGELEDAGLKGSGLYSAMQRLHAEYENADDKRRTQISDQLDRLNKQAKKVLKAR